MKKLSLVALVLLGVMMTSCGFYTCPTYAGKKAPAVEKHSKI
jgi:hypothetical protein